ncbi:MAG: flagellar protein FlaG [Gammaproteobacteria bacterium]|nr:flagellar protein FlaG [Gammaproteobacteria bacterium]
MVNEINNHPVITTSISHPQPAPAVARTADREQKAPPAADHKQMNPVKEQTTAPVDEGEVAKAVEDLNKYTRFSGRDLQFTVDRDSGHTIITVMDRETEQVIRQIPPEQAITLAKFLDQSDDFSSTGLLEEA